MSSRPFEIDPLHPEILRAYRAKLHGTDSHGIADIEFPDLHTATSWAQTCDVQMLCWLRDDMAGRTRKLACTVVLQLDTSLLPE